MPTLTDEDVPWLSESNMISETDDGRKTILNEETGKYVFINGKKGQEILKMLKKRGPKAKTLTLLDVPWMDPNNVKQSQNMIRNPKSQRFVAVDGPTGQGILKRMIEEGPPTEEEIPDDLLRLVAKYADHKTKGNIRATNKGMRDSIKLESNLNQRVMMNKAHLSSYIRENINKFLEYPENLFLYETEEKEPSMWIQIPSSITQSNKKKNVFLFFNKKDRNGISRTYGKKQIVTYDAGTRDLEDLLDEKQKIKIGKIMAHLKDVKIETGQYGMEPRNNFNLMMWKGYLGGSKIVYKQNVI